MPSIPSLKIRRARAEDLASYVELVQRVSQATYPAPEIGMGPDLFAPEVYRKPPIGPLLAERLSPESGILVWLAFSSDKLIGTIALHPGIGRSELLGLYVDPSYQGHGAGAALWHVLLKANKGGELWLTTYMHCTHALEIYRHWGFITDSRRQIFVSQWPGLKAGHGVRGVYLVRSTKSLTNTH